MSRDSSATHLHMHSAHHADLLESFTNQSSSHLQPEEILIAPHLQPINPEDEDDVVPDQHAAFGIQQARQQGQQDSRSEPEWRDLGIDELLRQGPRNGGEPPRTALRRRPGAGNTRNGASANDNETNGGERNALPR